MARITQRLRLHGVDRGVENTRDTWSNLRDCSVSGRSRGSLFQFSSGARRNLNSGGSPAASRVVFNWITARRKPHKRIQRLDPTLGVVISVIVSFDAKVPRASASGNAEARYARSKWFPQNEKNSGVSFAIGYSSSIGHAASVSTLTDFH